MSVMHNVAKATTAGLKAVVEKYDLPDEAYTIYKYAFEEAMTSDNEEEIVSDTKADN